MRRWHAEINPQHAMLRGLELTPDMHHELIEHAAQAGVRFLSTGFDIESVDLLLSLGIELLKVPSGEITNLPYLRHIGTAGCNVILSTGMATLDEVGAALEVLEKAGTPRDRVTVAPRATAHLASFRFASSIPPSSEPGSRSS